MVQGGRYEYDVASSFDANNTTSANTDFSPHVAHRGVPHHDGVDEENSAGESNNSSLAGMIFNRHRHDSDSVGNRVSHIESNFLPKFV